MHVLPARAARGEVGPPSAVFGGRGPFLGRRPLSVELFAVFAIAQTAYSANRHRRRMVEKPVTTSGAPIHDAETALTHLLGVSRETLYAWLSGRAVPPANVRVSPDLIAFVQRKNGPIEVAS